ncbi:MAG: hypothetical protein KIS76_01810 [Pyrinomonadaceae bacterium]|nr:hypothetical protein [Pyrinomonadaceae bacterium]
MNFRLICISFIFFSFFALKTLAQDQGELTHWQKIKIFLSTKDEVEQLFGKSQNNEFRVLKGEQTPTYARIYELADATVFVVYSSGGCEKNPELWDVSEWTVLEIEYSPNEDTIKLIDILPDKTRYKSKQAGDVVDHIEYFDDQRGVSITYDKFLDQVLHIKFYPSEHERKLRDCKRKEIQIK